MPSNDRLRIERMWITSRSQALEQKGFAPHGASSAPYPTALATSMRDICITHRSKLDTGLVVHDVVGLVCVALDVDLLGLQSTRRSHALVLGRALIALLARRHVRPTPGYPTLAGVVRGFSSRHATILEGHHRLERTLVAMQSPMCARSDVRFRVPERWGTTGLIGLVNVLDGILTEAAETGRFDLDCIRCLIQTTPE